MAEGVLVVVEAGRGVATLVAINIAASDVVLDLLAGVVDVTIVVGCMVVTEATGVELVAAGTDETETELSPLPPVVPVKVPTVFASQVLAAVVHPVKRFAISEA